MTGGTGRWTGPRVRAGILAIAALAAGCSQVISPSAVADAQTLARARTVLVNDASLGLRPVEVRVVDGAVTLSGRVASEAEALRAVDLVRAVAGVRSVASRLEVVPAEAAAGLSRAGAVSPRLAGEVLPDRRDWDDRRILGVGVSFGGSLPADEALGATPRFGPLVRFGSGEGLGVSVGFGWFRADLRPPAQASAVGHVRIRPIMAGLGYTLRYERLSATWSLVGGPAFNGIAQAARAAGPRWALDVDNSLAWRGGVSVWIELTERTAYHVSLAHTVTRPTVTYFENGRTWTEPLRGDTTIVNTGLVLKLF